MTSAHQPLDREVPRTLPQNVQAEQALLGALLLRNDQIERIDFLRGEDFVVEVHGRIFDAIRTFHDRGHLADPLTLKTIFDQDEGLQELGGAAYLGKLVANVIMIVNVDDYGRTIHDLSLRRKIIEATATIAEAAWSGKVDGNAGDVLELAESTFFSIAERGDAKAAPKSFAHYVEEALGDIDRTLKAGGKIVGLPCGLIDLDRALGGFHQQDLIVLAGRTSMGKTALAARIAVGAARAEAEANDRSPRKVLFFSLEMAGRQLALREIAGASGISAASLRGVGEPAQYADAEGIAAAGAELSRLPLEIDEGALTTVPRMMAKARRVKRRHGLALVLVDYLQLIHRSEKVENRVQEIAAITKALKGMAKELDVPVIALSQLSRQVEHREDKRPQLADLRDSGSIEQDADIVMFVFREEYYVSRSAPTRRQNESQNAFDERLDEWLASLEKVAGTAEVIIAKQRQGPIATIELHWDAELAQFSNSSRRA